LAQAVTLWINLIIRWADQHTARKATRAGAIPLRERFHSS